MGGVGCGKEVCEALELCQTVVVDSAAEEDGDIVRVFSIERDSQKGFREAEK
jgi:hypothetical protein